MSELHDASQTKLLVREDSQALATVGPVGAGQFFQMMQAAVGAGITPENADAIKKLAELTLQFQAVDARKAFFEAKAALQAEIPAVVATKIVPNNDKTVRYAYAPYESIMRVVAPLLTKHGFSIGFSQEIEETRLTSICTLTHILGHSEANRFAVRATKGPPGSSDAQIDGAASTYAKRFALCNCLNIVIDSDNDARAEGGFITPQQAASLRARVLATGSDEARFLKLADVATFEEIRTGKASVLDAMLRQKENAKGKGAAAPSSPGEPTDEEKARIRADELAASKQK